MKHKVAGSLFSGGGIGDVGLEWGAGIPVIAAGEIIPSRAALIRKNFPDSRVFEGDIHDFKDDYIEYFQKYLQGLNPWLLTLSPPCQGMSSNGAGRISAEIKAGKRHREDQRNRLILPGIEILQKLKPDWFILENVKRMENTIIRNERGQSENILDCLSRRLYPSGYSIFANILDFRDYGVPHHRERLITIGCRIPSIAKRFKSTGNVFSMDLSPFHAPVSHGKVSNQEWMTIRETIGHLRELDARSKLSDPNDLYHCIPKWNDNQYFWMQHTPEGRSAFENLTCPVCQKRSSDSKATRCACGALLPRPQIIRSGNESLVRGFKTSYRRMLWDKPASTLTMNSGVISSDVKGHPEQNRVLSLREILLLSTLDNPEWKKTYSFEGIRYGRMSPDDTFSKKLVREVIGESIPPLAMMKLAKHIQKLEQDYA
tara:strand:+ start:310 stop:1596 length:1287 start_codon:yes stop_codon:yes gene_type:complete